MPLQSFSLIILIGWSASPSTSPFDHSFTLPPDSTVNAHTIVFTAPA